MKPKLIVGYKNGQIALNSNEVAKINDLSRALCNLQIAFLVITFSPVEKPFDGRRNTLMYNSHELRGESSR